MERYRVTYGRQGDDITHQEAATGAGCSRTTPAPGFSVFDRGLERDALAMKVLRFLEENSAAEFVAFAKYVGLYRPGLVASLEAAA